MCAFHFHCVGWEACITNFPLVCIMCIFFAFCNLISCMHMSFAGFDTHVRWIPCLLIPFKFVKCKTTIIIYYWCFCFHLAYYLLTLNYLNYFRFLIDFGGSVDCLYNSAGNVGRKLTRNLGETSDDADFIEMQEQVLTVELWKSLERI